MGMTWSEYKAYREKKKKEEEQTKKQQKASSSKAEKTITNNANNQEKNNNLINTISQNNRLPLNNENANKIASNTPSLQDIVSKNNSSKIVQSNNNPLAKQIEEQNAKKPLQKAIEEQKKKPKTTQKEPSTWERIMDNFRIGGYGGITGVAQTGYRDIRDIDNMYTDASSSLRHQVLSTFFGEHGENFARNIDDKIYKWNNDRNQVYNYALDVLNKEQQTNKQNIQQNIEAVKQSGDKVGTKFAELAPSVGNNAMGLLAGTVNPALAFTYYKGSSEASYYDDALQRGMTEDQAKVYSKLMSYVEAGTETISAGNILKGGKAIKAVASGAKNIGVKEGLKAGFNVFKESAKEETANALKQGLKSYGIGIAEEFFQEAITEPIQEFTAMKVAGEDKADWNNMWQRMLQSGVDGALSSAILAGANMGISSCQGIVTKVQNGQEFTTEEYNTAVKDASEKVDVGKMTTDGIKNQVVKLKTEMQQSQKEVNKDINPKNKMPQNQFSQAEKTETLRQEARNKLESIKQNYDENSYNQMQEFIETAPSEKALNQVISDLNKEAEKKQVAPLKTKQEVQLPMKQQETQNKSFEDVAFEAMNNYESNEVESPLKNRDMDLIGKQTKVNAYQYDNPKVKPYFQEMAQQMGEDLAYISSSDNRSTQKGGGTKLSTTTKAMDILHNEQGYSYNQIAQGLQNIIDDKGSENNAISKKIELVIDEQLRNGYTNALGKNIEPNQDYINTIQENKAVQLPTKQEKPNIINKKVNEYIDSVKDNFKSDINIKTQSINEGDVAPLDYNKAGQSVLAKKAQNLVDRLKTRVFKNNNEDIHVSNGDIRKSISETLKNQEQNKYKKENVAVFSQLDKVIENAKLLDVADEHKGRDYYSDYKYYVSNVYLDGNPFVVEFDTRMQDSGNGTMERHFRLERVYPLNNNEVVSNTVPKVNSDNTFLNETTSINNSIPQNNQNVKSDNTNINNMQNNQENMQQFSMSEQQKQNNFEYKESKNSKVDTFRKDASKYWDNSEKTNKLVNTIEKVINDKGYNIRLDDTLGDNINGRIVTNNQTGEIEITLNPNSSRTGEFILGHELTHAIQTQEMIDLVNDRMTKDGDLRNAVEDLKKLYGTDDINAEVLADISGQLFGTQEFINNLSVEKPSVFKRIYDTIVSLANKITGNSNEALFIKDLKNKWEKAYRENTNKITNAEYSLNKDGAMKDNKTGKKVTLQAESMNDGKNLLAIHNLDESKLKGVLELGGFPVPSIAITNPNIVNHSQFGDISVIFNKDTINPEIDSKNEVYDRDVWSPTFPEVDYQINDKAVDKVAKNIGIENWKLQDYAEDSKNPQELVNKLLNRDEIIDDFVDKNNIKYNEQYKDANLTKWYNKEDSIKKFIKENNVSLEKLQEDKSLRNRYFEELRKEFNTDADEVEAIEKQIDLIDHFLNDNYTERLQNLKQDFDVLTNEETKVLDKYETQKEKKRVAKENGIEKYLLDNIQDVFGEKGIYNGKEYLTPSGNRRSFWQLHDEYNLDNIVEQLTKGNTKGAQNWIAGYGQIQAQMANKFKSMQDIKTSKNKLTSLKENNEILEDAKNRVIEDIDNIVSKNDTDMSVVSELFADFAKGKLTSENFKDLTNKWYQTIKNVSDADITKIIEDLNNLKNLPTDYFEAKPQRAVGFDEIDAIIIPKDVSKEVKQQLKDRGIKTIEYDRNNENERADILKSLNEYKFSKTSKSWQDYLERNYKSEGTTTDLRDIRLPMKEKQEVKAPIKQENTKIKFDNEVMKTNSEIKGNSETPEKIAKILSEPTKNVKPEQRTWAILKANFIDKGAVFEKISQKTNNRDLQGKYDYTLTAGARGQYAIGNDRYVYSNGKKTLQSKSLTSIMDEVGENTQAFNEYMYHQLNVDRMTLDERFGIENKPVFGESITADISRAEIAKIEEQHPEFKEYANDVYRYLEANKQELVDKGVISQETSDFFKERYPHYVPIQRATRKGNSIDVALDTKRTGINSPIKKAKGGNQDINPLFQTMASQTLQTYRASARNNFGLELKNTLQQMNQLNENRAIADIDDIVDTMTNEEQNNELLQPGKKGENPTFTVFEDGKKITYDISQDMYDALKPKSEILNKLDNTKLAKAGRKISNFRRGVLTEYNPIFSITNALKDAQDVLINSQHSAKTYAKFPEAYAQIAKKGYWYNEYIQNGGEQNSYFTEGDFENIKSSKLDKAKNVLKFPLEKISQVNNVIEMAPRLAEYIVSRQNGANIETAMLDASRVTTNFKAGGDITKFANRNGATFLNASVQGFQQQVRNIQEANMKGLKGWTNLALKYTVAGLPALLLNNLFWDDDDDYEQLQDYVKDNYYVVAKLPNGNFLRIPKGRMVATIQKVVSNANDFVKDGKINSDDVASTIWNDLKEDVSFGMDNLAPNNPIDNNILSPIIQVAQNKTWYGDDLVPQRLQDVPEEEQADETTDKFSKWLGEKLKVSPIKINYLLDQYSGGIGDVLLPLGTPQAENNVIEDKFTTDPVMKSQYPADFFNKRDELNVRNNSLKATDEDKLKYKYISSIQSNISDLYKQKREIQASDKTDKEKKAELKKVQKQINELARESLETVDKVEINGNGAKIGEQEYYKKNGTWTKLTEKEKEKLRNTSMSTYSSYQSQISGKDLKDYEKIQILRDSNYSNEEKSNLYEKTISTDKYYSTLKKSGIDIDEYMDYKLAQSNGKFTADKKNGKTVMGSGKKKVLNYLNKNITGYGNRLLIAGKQYSLTDSQRKDLSDYINKTFATQAERTKVYEQLKLNFVVNGNRVTYK